MNCFNRLAALLVLPQVLMTLATLSYATDNKEVQYFTDSISEIQGDYMRLLGGTRWQLAGYSIALPFTDVIIVVEDIEIGGHKKQVAVAYMDGDETIVTLLTGRIETQTGYLTTVTETIGRGAVLRLGDGSLVTVPSYDQYDTGYWLPPYRVLITNNWMYLWNLKKGKRVWIKRE